MVGSRPLVGQSMLQIASFNCHSFKNSINEIQDLCKTGDLVFLQETWLSKVELSLLNDVDVNFHGIGNSAFNSYDALLSGRPYGGLAILWRK